MSSSLMFLLGLRISIFELESLQDTVYKWKKNLYYNTFIRTEERNPN